MIRIDNVRLPLTYSPDDLVRAAAKALRTDSSRIRKVTLARRSLDSRDKADIHFVAALRVSAEGEGALLRRSRGKNIYKEEIAAYAPPRAAYSGRHRPVIVGAGPAGLFAALYLAEQGLEPLVIERGQAVEQRRLDVEAFLSGGAFRAESNIPFGEGGAGTFSDGKLNTGTRDPRHRYILDTFISCGAPLEIDYLAKPHIGSDNLYTVVKNLRAAIEALGGEFRFGSRLCDLEIAGGTLRSICVEQAGARETVACDRLLLAVGHSAEDVYELLHARGFALEAKPFSAGVRIEHPRLQIDQAQYGRELPCGAADYKLTAHLPDGRAVYTFCMCPGGVVVPSCSADGTVVTNGMSDYARAAENSNSALLVNVGPADFDGADALAGLRFRRRIEQAAFRLGGGGFAAPVQRVGDFLAARATTAFGDVLPSYRPAVRMADLHDCLPPFICKAIVEALPVLDRKLHGFAAADALLTAAETRSSAPLRILRNDEGESSVGGVYPAGEGSGYAGGIMSSAADGLRAAERLATH